MFSKLKQLFSSSFFRATIIVALFAWYGFFLAHPIFLTPSDIGRHLKNGELFLTTPIRSWGPLLHTNFYSYTFTNFPFINHHWASGIVFYLVWFATGFVGLSFFGIIINFATLALCFSFTRKYAGFWWSALLAFVLIPLIGERTEIRPELFSNLFSVVYFYILTLYREKKAERLLWILPLLQIAWVNLHIYFFFGIILTGLFWLEAIFEKPRDLHHTKILTLLTLAVFVASFINPSHYRGVLYPLEIFGNYGASVGENQSVTQLSAQSEAAGLIYANLISFKLIFGLIVLGALFLSVKKPRRALPLAFFLWMTLLSFLTWRSVRNLAWFGFFAMPTLALIGKKLVDRFTFFQRLIRNSWVVGGVVFGSIILTLGINWSRIKTLSATRGLGLLAGSTDSARFIQDNKIDGPLFNDFDSGSFVAWTLFPRVKAFVDNRPEAFPANFFTETYVPLHTDDAVWRKTDSMYHFNAILYSFDDKAPFALPFIVTRILDPEWAPVYTDKFSIVLLKRNEKNKELIKKFEIPKEKFSVEPSP